MTTLQSEINKAKEKVEAAKKHLSYEARYSALDLMWLADSLEEEVGTDFDLKALDTFTAGFNEACKKYSDAVKELKTLTFAMKCIGLDSEEDAESYIKEIEEIAESNYKK